MDSGDRLHYAGVTFNNPTPNNDRIFIGWMGANWDYGLRRRLQKSGVVLMTLPRKLKLQGGKWKLVEYLIILVLYVVLRKLRESS